MTQINNNSHKQWSQNGIIYTPANTSSVISSLPPAIYKLGYDNNQGTFFLTKLLDKFVFPYKIYGNQDRFINTVLKTYNNTSGNLGILLNGIKGTGKTITAERLCNEFNLPVILVNYAFDNLDVFITKLNQPAIIFIDEYEKVYKDDLDEKILSILDGVFNTEHRKIFLMTTNVLNINVNLKSRPSRIRYIKNFGNLDIEVINEIVDDKLKILEFKEAVIEYILGMNEITVDSVVKTIEEVNIHKILPEQFKDYFNVSINSPTFSLYLTDNILEGNLKTDLLVFPCVTMDDFSIKRVGNSYTVVSYITQDRYFIGYYKKYINSNVGEFTISLASVMNMFGVADYKDIPKEIMERLFYFNEELKEIIKNHEEGTEIMEEDYVNLLIKFKKVPVKRLDSL